MIRGPRPALRSWRRPEFAIVALGLIVAGVLLSVLAQQIVRHDEIGRRALQERTAARMRLTNDSIDAYVYDLMNQIRAHGQTELSGPAPTADDFTRVAIELRMSVTALTDDRGVVLHALPSTAVPPGSNLAERLDHVRDALDGKPAVSDLVPGTEGRFVSIAVPYETPSGTRVLAGALDLRTSPIATLLRKSSLIQDQLVVLIDGNDEIIAGSRSDLSGTVAETDPQLAAGLTDRGGRSAVVDGPTGERYVASEPVSSAPWRIATTVSTAELYLPLGDRAEPWLLFGAFTVVSVLSIALMGWVIGQRRGLNASIEQLGALTTTLRANEEQMRRVIDTAGDAFVAIDEGGAVIAWNDEAETLFGWSHGEAVGRPLHELIIPEEFRDAHRAGMARLLETGEGPILDQRLEMEALRANGTLVPVELSIWALETETGWNFNALIRDISDRLHQQRALHDREEELRLTQENAATGMALVALDGYFIQVNPALCAIVDRSPDDLANLRMRDITLPDDRELDAELLDRLLGGAVNAYDVEKRFLRADGSAVWVEIHVSLLRDELGLPKRFIVQVLNIEQRKQHQDQLTREVTVRRQAEEAARRERDFSSVLLASMHEGYLFTTDGVVVDVNDQLCELTGFRRVDLVGRSMPYPFWPDHDDVNRRMDEVIAAGGGDLEVEFRKKDGERFPVALAIRTARNADGSTSGLITIVSDLTEVRRRESALIAAAAVDPLTGLYNRRAIDEQLTNLRPTDAVILLDLDYFKRVNDTYGHAAGDEVLTTLAGCIGETLRGKDWAGRLGGEEFVIVARDGDVAGALAVLDRLRRTWDAGRPVTTFSAGVAVHGFGVTAEQTLARADEAMYLAKRNGRNRTEVLAAGAPSTVGP